MPLTTQPTVFSRPFFEDKSRAFWTLQAVGWTGYLLLRGVSSVSNGLSLDAIIPVIIEAINDVSNGDLADIETAVLNKIEVLGLTFLEGVKSAVIQALIAMVRAAQV